MPSSRWSVTILSYLFSLISSCSGMDLVEVFARIPSCKCTFLEATYPNLPTAVELYRTLALLSTVHW